MAVKPVVFNTKTAAEYTGLSPKTIRAYCQKARGIFKNAYKEGRDWRIPKSDVDSPAFKNRKIGHPFNNSSD